MRFQYTCLKDAKTITGIAEATDKETLIANLHRQEIRPLIIKVDTGKKSLLGRLKPSKKVKLKDLVLFTRQLSTMVSAGVPLTRSLSTLQTQTDNKFFKTVIADITKDVEGGQPLGQVFSKYPNIFSDVYVNMVKAGEAGGILDEILKRLATQIEQDASIRKKVKSAMMYPT